MSEAGDIKIENKRSKNSQMAINLIASIITFVVNLCVKFFLTPFIVGSLGTEAYGFIGLSTDIISYTSLITVALNSMAGRFITIEYVSGNIRKANKYFSSVFFSNVISSSVILSLAVFCVIWLEYFINIPPHLVWDVKALFSILIFNNLLGLVFGTWGVATFIKNRIELSTICRLISNLIYSSLLLVLFAFYAPHVWYIGLASVFMTLFIAITNIFYSRRLTPDLIVKKIYFRVSYVKELVSSGIWNVLNKIGDVLGYGLNLLVANLFMGSTAMGIFALTKNIPFVILAFFQITSTVFAPVQTQLYAQNKREELAHELNKSIRMLGFFTVIILTFLFVWGDVFYSLWLPMQDSKLLQLLTVLGILDYVLSMPIQSLWNIFTITNKLKYSSLSLLISSVLIITVILVSMQLTDSETIRLCVLAVSAAVVSLLRSLFFLPIYGAYCLNLPRTIFYKPMFKTVFSFAISVSLVFCIRLIWSAESWFALLLVGVITSGICSIISLIVLLDKSDRVNINNTIKKHLKL